jgi:hypothetical protein
MLMTAVESAVLSTLAYDHLTQCLWLEFRNGARYLYFGVSPALHQELLAAPSKGAYFNRRIRGRFPYQKQPPTKQS